MREAMEDEKRRRGMGYRGWMRRGDERGDHGGGEEGGCGDGVRLGVQE